MPNACLPVAGYSGDVHLPPSPNKQPYLMGNGRTYNYSGNHVRPSSHILANYRLRAGLPQVALPKPPAVDGSMTVYAGPVQPGMVLRPMDLARQRELARQAQVLRAQQQQEPSTSAHNPLFVPNGVPPHCRRAVLPTPPSTPHYATVRPFKRKMRWFWDWGLGGVSGFIRRLRNRLGSWSLVRFGGVVWNLHTSYSHW